MREFKYLDSICEVKDIDTKKRTVDLYIGKFNNVDLGNDILLKGSSTKTIHERGPEGADQIRHLWDHSTFHPIGKPLEMAEDDKGIWVKSWFDESTFSNDKFIQYKSDVVKFQSIGYSTIQSDEEKTEDGTDIRLLQEIKLYEYSGVVLPMNEQAGLKAFKSMVGPDGLIEHIKKLEKFCRESTASDETLMAIQSELKRFSLLFKKPEPSTSIDNEPSLLEIYLQTKSQ